MGVQLCPSAVDVQLCRAVGTVAMRVAGFTSGADGKASGKLSVAHFLTKVFPVVGWLDP